jgi:hypothetical protein
MASVLHGSARTTPRIRAEFQASKASARALAARYGLNAKTVRKWRKRTMFRSGRRLCCPWTMCLVASSVVAGT